MYFAKVLFSPGGGSSPPSVCERPPGGNPASRNWASINAHDTGKEIGIHRSHVEWFGHIIG